MGFFRYDGPLMKALVRIGNLIILSFFWILTCLPLITAVPACAAAFHTVTKVIRTEGSGVARDFFSFFRKSLKQGIPLSLIAAVSGFLLFLAVRYGSLVWRLGTLQTAYFAVGILFTILWLTMMLFLPPVFSRFRCSVFDTVRLSLYIASRNLPRCAWMLLLLAVTAFLIDFYPVALLILPAVYIDLTCGGIEKALQKYMAESDLDGEAPDDRQEAAAEPKADFSAAQSPAAELSLHALVKVYPWTETTGRIIGRKKALEALARERSQPYTTDEGVLAVQDFSLHVGAGEFVVLLGPTGCGKSTILRMIAGLESVSAGQVVMNGKDITDTPPEDRDIAMVFQNNALYAHLSVYDNLAFPLRNRHIPRGNIDETVRTTAGLLGLRDCLEKRPRELSGGQQQRVAVGRAVVRQAGLYLLDEPFSSLDPPLRRQLRQEIRSIHEKTGATFLFVTHDQAEAFSLGNRIVVMKDGMIEQEGSPAQLLDDPDSLFVAAFVGTPHMNLLKDAHIIFADGQPSVRCAGFGFPIAPQALPAVPEGTAFTAGFRPDRLQLSSSGIPASVETVTVTGPQRIVTLDVSGRELTAVFPLEDKASAALQTGGHVAVRPDPERIVLFDSGTGKRIRA